MWILGSWCICGGLSVVIVEASVVYFEHFVDDVDVVYGDGCWFFVGDVFEFDYA